MAGHLDKVSAQSLATEAMRKGDFVGAAETWQSYRQASPWDMTGWVQGVLAWWKAQQGPAAQSLVRAALVAFPDEQSLHMLAAQVDMGFGDPRSAESHWRRFLGRDPHSIPGLKGLAEALIAQERWQDADESLRLALRHAPQDLSIAVAHASLSTRQGDWAEAERRWSELGRNHPGSNDAALGLAEALLGQNRLKEASEVLDRLPAEHGDDLKAKRLAARIASAESDWRAAERLWSRVVALNLQDPSAWLQRAAALAALGELKYAKAVLVQATQYLPRNMYLLRALAQNAMARRDWREACDYWLLARTEGPHRLDAWMYIVHLRRLLQQNDLADAECASAMEQMIARTAYSARPTPEAAAWPKEVFEGNERIRLEAYTRLPLDWPDQPSIEVLHDVFVVPQDSWRPRPGAPSPASKNPFRAFFGEAPPMLNGGVYTADGRIVQRAIHHHGMWAYVPDACLDAGPEQDHLTGRWLFGGATHRHFGHFLIEGTSRLWALDEIPEKVEGVVFYCGCVESNTAEEVVQPSALAEWVRVVSQLSAHVGALQVFTGNLPVRIVVKPTKVDELIVPTQLSGYFPRQPELMNGHYVHRAYLRACVDRICPKYAVPPVKVYVSRAYLPIHLGFFFQEDLFEENMRQEGYIIIHPEGMSFPDQLILYRRASHIVIGSGSACHVLALATTDRQRVAVIARQQSTDPVFATQIAATGADVTEIGAYRGYFEPRNDAQSAQAVKLGSHRVIAIVDWTTVWARLKDAGFVAGPLLNDGNASLPAARAEISRRLQERYGVPFVENYVGKEVLF